MEDSLHDDAPRTPPVAGPSGLGSSGPAQADASPVAAGPPLPRTRQPMSDATRDAIARMIVMGAPVSTVAAVTGRRADTIHAALQSGPLAERVEYYSGEVIRQIATHKFELMAMLPQARVAIQGGLASQDERCRLETSKWLHEVCVPKPVARAEMDVRLSGGMTHDVSGVLEKIGTSLTAIRELNAGRDPLARVRTGPEALPRVALLPSPEGDAA